MKPRVALLLGDPCGIGPELVAKLLSEPDVTRRAKIILIGSLAVYRRGEEISSVSNSIEVVSSIDQVDFDDKRPSLVNAPAIGLREVPLGRVSVAAGRYVLQSLTLAVQYAQAGQLDALCYAPLNKEAMHRAGNPFPDELQFIAHQLGFRGSFREFNVLDDLWSARVSSHVPLRDVAQYVTQDKILEIIELTDETIRQSGVARPKLAVAGLNPHAGDGGLIGREEIEIIQPAVKVAQDKGLDVHGPFSPDAVFPIALKGHYDGVVTMYHDQGQIAIKLMSPDYPVTVQGGMPIPITTPAHGTAFDIVGQGIAKLGAMRKAFLMSCAMGEADE